MKTKHIRAPLTLKADSQTGEVSAVVSTFGVVDSDGDVVLASAFTDGQAVPMVWSHNWDMPVGKGVIRVQPDRAVFEGQFFTETIHGRDAYQTVRAMAELQEFSWGFRVLDAEQGDHNGQVVRFIKATEVYEISPVLVGANRDTGLLAIKSRATVEGKYSGLMSGVEPPEGSYEALSEDLEEAFEAANVPDGVDGYVSVVATFADHFVAYLWLDGQEESYWDVPFRVAPDGETVTLGTATQVELEMTYAPVKGRTAEYGMHAARVERTVREFVERTKAGSALRRKEGRPISEARRTRMAAIRDGLRTSADDLHAILEETAPKEPAKAIDVSHELAAFLAFEARRNGVPIGA